jgi:glycosyltransferase involved in cell wall biosynthesis
MKLIVQIPCFNEEDTLASTVRDIPRRIEGIEKVEILIIDDGSTDRTVLLAREIGVEHIVRNKRNLGLARAFIIGIDACLKRGADIIVNTDGDNQYAGADIPKLIQPIVEGRADIVIGNREPHKISHFSPLKRWLQRVGSLTVRRLSGLDVPDPVSGFRAYSRDAALALNVVSEFSYTIESIVQASSLRFSITSVPVRTNGPMRESRLFKSIPQFLHRQLSTMFRMYAMYRPLRVFAALGAVLLMIGGLPILRFLYFYFFTSNGTGHLQSLVLGGVLVTLGFLTLVIALLADLIGWNRKLIEVMLEKVRRLELSIATDFSDERERVARRHGDTHRPDHERIPVMHDEDRR